MTQEFLNRADVVAVLEQVRRNEWRKVWHVTRWVSPAAFPAWVTARWMTDGCKYMRHCLARALPSGT
jgi:hypothetical protein